MEYYDDKLCISYDDLTRNDAPAGQPSDAIMSASNYYKLAASKQINVVRAGKGLNNYALIELESLPERFRERIRHKYPQGANMYLHRYFDRFYELDTAAREFYSTEVYKADGANISTKVQKEYTINASVLNTIIKFSQTREAVKRSMGGKMKWDEVVEAVEYFRTKVGHTLPASRLQDTIRKYKEGSYAALVSKKYNNQSARKVSVNLERLIIAIAVQDNSPFNTMIMEQINAFFAGEIDVVDTTTGELFNPEDFYKNGEPITISRATVWNYINNPKNRVIIENMRQDWTNFNHSMRPHMRRASAFFSFSKISLDDRDLPRKTHAGIRPKAYYAYDVASGCVIGYAYSREKTTALFIDCLRNMFRVIDRNGWNMPGEIEVENHIVSQFKDTFMEPGVIFSFVRWCAPTNSQEKRAEHFNRAKKYSVEKKNHAGIGRWWLRLSANKVYDQKVFDEKNNTYVDKKTYDYEELIADDLADIFEYNNMPHPNQKLYPGMTRWQVLCNNMNPNLRPMDKRTLYRFIGECTSTSINRNSCVRVQYRDFWLSNPDVLKRLDPNDNKVKAYYLPDKNGNFDEVYIYQDGDYIDTCRYIGEYQEAQMERTEDDEKIFLEQRKYISKFDKMVKDNKPTRVQVISQERKQNIEQLEQQEVKAIPLPPEEEPQYTIPEKPQEQEKEMQNDYELYLDLNYITQKAKADL